MAITDLDIANSALAKIGSFRIASLSELTEPARLLNKQLPLRRRKMLREHKWNFAMKRALLVETTEPVFGFAKAYTLPSDSLKAVDTDVDGYPWEIEGMTLVTDEGTVNLRYVFDNTDYDTWTSDAIELLALDLAHELSFALTQNASLKQGLYKELDDALKLARSIDAQEGRKQQQVKSRSWNNARYGGTRG